jgi:hypothetical protein
LLSDTVEEEIATTPQAIRYATVLKGKTRSFLSGFPKKARINRLTEWSPLPPPLFFNQKALPSSVK